jgi:predicted ester cyclase
MSGMATNENLELVHRLFEAFNERRFDQLEGTIFSPALVYRNNGRESDLKGWIRDSRSCVLAFPDARIVPGEESVQGDRVTAHFRFQGTHLGPLGDQPASSRSFDVAGTSTFRIMDGLIVEDTDQVDETDLGRQLGLA